MLKHNLRRRGTAPSLLTNEGLQTQPMVSATAELELKQESPSGGVACPHRPTARSPLGRWLRRLPLLIVTGAGLAGLVYADRPEAHFRRGMTALHGRDWERLDYEYWALAGRRGYEARASLFAGALRLQESDFDGALNELAYAKGQPETSVDALVLGGQAMYAQGKLRPAEIVWGQALAIDPDHVDAHRWLAIAYYDIGLMTEALNHFQKVADLEPGDARPHRIMGVVRMDHGNLSAAVSDLEESLRRDPRQPDRQQILLELAQCQERLHRYDDALRTLNECDETAESQALSASIRYAQARPDDAERLAKHALELNSQERLALLVLGKLAIDRRQPKRALLLLDRAAEAAPTDSDVHFSLAVALRASGQVQRAQAEMDMAQNLKGLRERSDKLFQQTIKEPYNAEVRYQLGLLAEQAALGVLAETWFRAAVLLQPDHRPAQAKVEEYRRRRAQHSESGGQGSGDETESMQ
jgi:tetratricopeptide (TPR) repeat protein